MNVKYLINRISKMDYTRMFKMVNIVSKKTKKTKLLVFLDMTYCGIKYQAGYIDYDLFQMYDLSALERKTIVTRGLNNRFVNYFNDKNYFDVFSHKEKFNKRFNTYLKREWLLLEDNYKEFEKFLVNKEIIIAKPLDGMCGKGIEKIKVSDYKSRELFNYLISKNLFLVEEYIIQCDELNKMYPKAINTVRLVTVAKNKKTAIVAAYLRIGNNDNFVDNFNSGGMVVPIDVESGIINYPALDKKGNLYKKHPATGTAIIGYQVPKWNEVIALGNKLATVVDEIGLVGWDISVSTKGPLIVEGNEFPGHDIYQLPPHRTNNIGMLKEFIRAFKEIGVKLKDIK